MRLIATPTIHDPLFVNTCPVLVRTKTRHDCSTGSLELRRFDQIPQEDGRSSLLQRSHLSGADLQHSPDP